MLVAEIYVNFTLIDEIHIKNMGKKEGELTIYKIVKPEVKNPKILHKRDLGYGALLKNALEIIEIDKRFNRKD